ncbi:MAG: nucleotidyl transferase AbiEii/AbiGii toxin family protein [Actinomycetota bacterium]|nr:nucleotidyl transferase AbiEii/AbiGii toxin family protein [Actinomycetota bacterium]
MAPADKPRHRSGYTAEETLQVQSACLTVAVTLGAYLDDLCIVGGLVPSLLIDRQLGPDPEADAWHPGTNDLDIGLAVALLHDERYAEISRRLRQEGFGPDRNADGNEVLQRWRLGDLRVTIDFLMAPAPSDEPAGRIQPLESDFGVLVTSGLELAFDERIKIELEGHTLNSEKVARAVPVCGPAAFVVLKALAFGDRAEPKDAYDLVYVVRRSSAAPESIAERLSEHAGRHAEIVDRALTLLLRDFRDPGGLGPRRAAAFDVIDPDELDAAAADAHG